MLRFFDINQRLFLLRFFDIVKQYFLTWFDRNIFRQNYFVEKYYTIQQSTTAFFAKKQHKFSTLYAKILPHFLHSLEVFGEICKILSKKIVLYSVFWQDFSLRFFDIVLQQFFSLLFNSKRQHFLHRLAFYGEDCHEMSKKIVLFCRFDKIKQSFLTSARGENGVEK